MDNNHPDLEGTTILNIPRHVNKKMRKRKHLDALLKFRSVRKNSKDILRSSEDELFLQHQPSSITRSRTPTYHRCWFYLKRLLSFGFICIVISACTALIFANIELKNEVRSLTSRIDQIEEKFSNIYVNNLSLIVKQMNTRVELLEQQSVSSTQSSSRTNSEDDVNEKIKTYLVDLVQNSSEKTSVILNELQTNLNKLRNQIDQCQCSKSIPLKPSVVDSDHLQQSLITKPNVLTPLITTISTHSTMVINDNQTENITDIEQIVNRPSIPG